MPIPATAAVLAPLQPGLSGKAKASSETLSAPNFLSSVNQALEHVSHSQRVAHDDGQQLVMGLPGASLENTLVASMHARVEWSAAVAVRNGVVNAYKSIINMPV